MRSKNILIVGFVMMFALIAANVAMAQTTETSNLVISATVSASCRITSVTDINFGAYDPTDPTDLDGAGDIRFRCVKGTSYDTYITGTREMNSVTSGDNLAFELYSDSGRTTVFPSANPSNPDTSANNGVVTTDVYGRVTALQDVGFGDDYTVTLTATIEY